MPRLALTHSRCASMKADQRDRRVEQRAGALDDIVEDRLAIRVEDAVGAQCLDPPTLVDHGHPFTDVSPA